MVNSIFPTIAPLDSPVTYFLSSWIQLTRCDTSYIPVSKYISIRTHHLFASSSLFAPIANRYWLNLGLWVELHHDNKYTPGQHSDSFRLKQQDPPYPITYDKATGPNSHKSPIAARILFSTSSFSLVCDRVSLSRDEPVSRMKSLENPKGLLVDYWGKFFLNIFNPTFNLMSRPRVVGNNYKQNETVG
jgi:hypothetical protein